MRTSTCYVPTTVDPVAWYNLTACYKKKKKKKKKKMEKGRDGRILGRRLG